MCLVKKQASLFCFINLHKGKGTYARQVLFISNNADFMLFLLLLVINPFMKTILAIF